MSAPCQVDIVENLHYIPVSMFRHRLNAVLEQNVLSGNVFLHLLQHTYVTRSAGFESRMIRG
jgi:hypothetical protein